MRKIKFIITAFLSIGFITGCESIINLKPDGALTTDLVLSTVEGLEGSILGVYERARSPFENNDLNMYETAGTDLVAAGTHLGDQAVAEALSSYNSNLNPDNGGVRNIWNAMYTGLNRVNIIISKIDNVDGINPNDLAQAKRINTVKGESYFFRAYLHFLLLKKWENIVLVMDAPESISLEAELSSPVEVVAAIRSDLQTAISLLPESVPSNGKVSSATANHLYAKVLMWDGDFAGAAAAAEAVIANPNYALVGLDEIFNTRNEENSEILLAWQFDISDPDHPSRTCQQWFPLYDRVNGVARTFEQGGRPWARIHPNEYYWTLFDSNGDGSIDDETDGRLATWHKRYWYFDDAENVPDGYAVGDVVTLDNIGAIEPRYITPTTTKYQEDGFLGRQIGEAQGFKNVIQYRLAETYLIAAEAYMEMGNTDKALSFVNVLRDRAYDDSDHRMTSLDEASYLDEHARELAHEGVRLELLQRRGILYSRAREFNPQAAAAMQPYHVRWPIPRSFTQTTGVPQNEGYL